MRPRAGVINFQFLSGELKRVAMNASRTRSSATNLFRASRSSRRYQIATFEPRSGLSTRRLDSFVCGLSVWCQAPNAASSGTRSRGLARRSGTYSAIIKMLRHRHALNRRRLLRRPKLLFQPEAAFLRQSLQEQAAATRSLVERYRIRRLPPGAAFACRPSAGRCSRSRARWWV
jgi:hypothetical protein